MLRSNKIHALRLVLAPLFTLASMMLRGAGAAKNLVLVTVHRLRHPIRLRGPRREVQPSPVRRARAGLINMIAIVVFAVAARYVIFELASSPGQAAADSAPPRALQRASLPAARGREPLLSISLNADSAYVPTGGTVAFTVQVAHAGAGFQTADDVTITAALADGLYLVSGPVCNLPSEDGTATCRYDPESRSVTARMAALDGPRHVAQVAYVARVDGQIRCGSSIQSIARVAWGQKPGGGAYRADSATELTVSRGGDGSCPTELPGITFGEVAPGAVVTRSRQSVYADANMFLDVPGLGLSQMSILGVPLAEGSWDISGLGDSAGWLETTAVPGQRGNSVLTAHVTDIYGRDGPFAQLHALGVGDQILVHAAGAVSTYLVQSVREVAPDDLSILEHSGLPLLTLLTCAEPNYTTHTYDARLVVQALMIQQVAQP